MSTQEDQKIWNNSCFFTSCFFAICIPASCCPASCILFSQPASALSRTHQDHVDVSLKRPCHQPRKKDAGKTQKILKCSLATCLLSIQLTAGEEAKGRCYHLQDSSEFAGAAGIRSRIVVPINSLRTVSPQWGFYR